MDYPWCEIDNRPLFTLQFADDPVIVANDKRLAICDKMGPDS